MTYSHNIWIDEEVHHFLLKAARKLNVDTNAILREMIFGERATMSATVRAQLERDEEAPYEKRLTDDELIGLPPVLGGTGKHVEIEED